MKLKNSAFTLIETMVSMVILSATLAGAVYLMMTISNATSKNQMRVQAIYLAQECTELLRNSRDSAWKQNLPWNCAFPSTTSSYRIISDVLQLPATTNPTQCLNELGSRIEADIGASDFARLYLDGNVYTHDPTGATKTPFSRVFTVSDVITGTPNPDAKKITCTVEWNDGGQPREISFSQILTNWYKK